MRTLHTVTVRTVALLAVASALALAACGPQSREADGSASPTPARTPADTALQEPVPAPAGSDFVVQAPQAPPATVPRVVGRSLQAAQDEARAAGFSVRSDDALGRSRAQEPVRDWKVCSQVPAGGMRLATGNTLAFNTVKVDESCP
ncbi:MULTISPECIES: PASTA domain-containing protein, partial [unclassified Streptomyces]|uniref:PASTA domain-containing protein n=1 Tax=Streptomyces sp. NRRL F-4428 TaxID=1609137 RepID=UPI0005ED2B3D